MLLILISLTKLSFCQIGLNNTEYPKVMIIDGDTVCVLSMENLDSVNVKLVDKESCDQELSNCEDINDKNDQLLKEELDKNSKNQELLQEKDVQLTEKDNIIENQKTIIGNNDDIVKEKDKKIRRANLKFGTSTVLSAILAVALIIIAI
jgi:hypothetical protein